MFKFLRIRDQLLAEKKKNSVLLSMVNKNRADTDYIAMMTDVNIFEDLEDEEPKGEISDE